MNFYKAKLIIMNYGKLAGQHIYKHLFFILKKN